MLIKDCSTIHPLFVFFLFSQFIEAFGSVVESSGEKIEDEQIERLFMQIDANSDGGIDWSEFSDYMLMESQANQTEIAEKVVSNA